MMEGRRVQMCNRCEALQDEVDYLRLRLAERLSEDLIRILAKTFGFTPGEARVVAAIYQARGLVLKTWELEECAKPDRAANYDGNVMQVHVGRIRRKTERDFIGTIRGCGYALSDAARLAIAKAVMEDNEARTLPGYEVLPAKGTTWDAVKVGKLAQMRRDGLSYSECARRLGISRNAAISAGNRYLQEGAQ